MVYSPSVPVVREAETLVASFVTVTVAFGTTAPVGSVTAPVKVPLVTWARALRSVTATIPRTTNRYPQIANARILDIDYPFRQRQMFAVGRRTQPERKSPE